MNLPTILSKDRPEAVFIAVRNAEASAGIAQGEPVCWVMNGTNDGNDVVLPNTGAAGKATSLFAGVCVDIDGIPNATYGKVQVYGLCLKSMLEQRTRAATTDSWSSVASIPAGNICGINTVNNNFVTLAAGAQSGFLGFAMMAESQASIVGSASSTSDSATGQEAKVKMFLRAM